MPLGLTLAFAAVLAIASWWAVIEILLRLAAFPGALP
jgi:hypothetical protein